jgi:Flp pilus assembly protein TadG
MKAIARRFHRTVALFAAEHCGVAALEFAMLLPMMMTLFLGSVEVSTGVAIHRKVTLAARTIADLSSQFTAIDNADMTNILNSSTDIVFPYAAANLAAVVSELAVDAQGNATVVWSDTLNGTAREVGSAVTIPANLAVPNSYLLLGETSYGYKPSYGYVVTGTMSLSDQIYMHPRQSNSVTRNNS